jgi:hypothetical protein
MQAILGRSGTAGEDQRGGEYIGLERHRGVSTLILKNYGQ